MHEVHTAINHPLCGCTTEVIVNLQFKCNDCNDCVAKGYTVSQIDRILKRNKSTVSRELSRNGSSRELPIFPMSIFKKTLMK